MNTLGIYIFNSTRNAWLVDDSTSPPTWGSFDDAREFPEGAEDHAEEVRDAISGDDVTFTMAALH